MEECRQNSAVEVPFPKRRRLRQLQDLSIRVEDFELEVAESEQPQGVQAEGVQAAPQVEQASGMEAVNAD